MKLSIDGVVVVDACSAAVQIVEWIELERENLVRQLHLLRSVFVLTRPERSPKTGPAPPNG